MPALIIYSELSCFDQQDKFINDTIDCICKADNINDVLEWLADITDDYQPIFVIDSSMPGVDDSNVVKKLSQVKNLLLIADKNDSSIHELSETAYKRFSAPAELDDILACVEEITGARDPEGITEYDNLFAPGNFLHSMAYFQYVDPVNIKKTRHLKYVSLFEYVRDRKEAYSFEKELIQELGTAIGVIKSDYDETIKICFGRVPAPYTDSNDVRNPDYLSMILNHQSETLDETICEVRDIYAYFCKCKDRILSAPLNDFDRIESLINSYFALEVALRKKIFNCFTDLPSFSWIEELFLNLQKTGDAGKEFLRNTKDLSDKIYNQFHAKLFMAETGVAADGLEMIFREKPGFGITTALKLFKKFDDVMRELKHFWLIKRYIAMNKSRPKYKRDLLGDYPDPEVLFNKKFYVPFDDLKHIIGNRLGISGGKVNEIWYAGKNMLE